MPPATPRTLKSPSKASPAKSSQKTELTDDMKSPDPSKISTTTPKSATSTPRIATSVASPADKSTAAATARKGTPTENSTTPGRKDLTTPKSGRKDLTTPGRGGSSTQNNPSQTPPSVPESGVMTSSKKAGLCF